MNRREAAVTAVEAALGHEFKDAGLLERALTHSSARQKTGQRGGDYERLEFLGDRVLGLLVAERLMRARPGADENLLTRHFHQLVNRDACARVARAVGLGEALRMAGGETRSGLRDNDTVLGDAMEAILAALYLDGGLDAARRALDRIWAEEFDRPAPTAVTANPKLALQEWAAREGLGHPVYRVVEHTGPAHAPRFVVAVRVEEREEVTAAAGAKSEAEKAAALAFLAREGVT
ncbi:ribonuclease III [Brevundimonas sp. 2R-24]|uniref:Ribonuclease 3 n=1 Tax=Peiella sedimenti TaxID=3061083 RepID=A0ABT8SPZ9_9CAUL|nr:ribonuclease III [Caulobacteraceae bacterium XZ-24]